MNGTPNVPAMYSARSGYEIVNEIAGNHGFRPLDSDVRVWSGVGVTNLEENPLLGIAASADQYPLPTQLLSF